MDRAISEAETSPTTLATLHLVATLACSEARWRFGADRLFSPRSSSAPMLGWRTTRYRSVGHVDRKPFAALSTCELVCSWFWLGPDGDLLVRGRAGAGQLGTIFG
jgi:hypothetical protein